MRRLCLLGFCLLLGSVLVPNAVAAREPVLWSASQQGGHVRVTFSVGALAPGQFVVATSPRLDRSGALARGVKLRERLTVTTTTRRVHWRSQRELRSGVYFVQVSGIEVDGVTSCTPPLLGCGQRWSNVLRVVVPAARR